MSSTSIPAKHLMNNLGVAQKSNWNILVTLDFAFPDNWKKFQLTYWLEKVF